MAVAQGSSNAKAALSLTLDVGGRKVTVSNPEKVYFPETGLTKQDLVNYYIAVSAGAVRAISHRPLGGC